MAAQPMYITFYKNDGSNQYLNKNVLAGNTFIVPFINNIVIPKEQPYDWTREEYEFIEWNSESDGSGESYSPGDEVTLNYEESYDGKFRLYAIWKEQRKLISKIQLPNDSIRYLSVDWQDISNKPVLTREQVIEIVEDLYPNATSAEVEEMADDILENSNTIEDMIEYLLAMDSTTPTEYAPVDSPHLTGVPTAPTANENTNTTQIATTAFVQTAVGSKLTRQDIIDIIEDLCPEATSTEIENMADDILENYNTVTEDMIEEILSRESGTPISYAPAASPQLTGVPTAPTAAAGTNTTQIATTAFVQQAIANIGNVQGVLYGN